MDEILAKASSQAMSFAIRSGISIASGFAIKTVSKFLDKIPQSEKARIEAAKSKLRTKVSIVSNSIDLIKLEAARGGSALEPSLQLANDLQDEIDRFDEQMVIVLENFDSSNEKESIRLVENTIKELVESINDAIPLINLSLITSGASFTSAMDSKVSPSKLLQSSYLICDSNAKFESQAKPADVIVGPVFDLKLYTVFYNPSRFKYIEEGDNVSVSSSATDRTSSKLQLAISWKEEFARALCSLVRSQDSGFSYHLVIKEDFDDNRYHEEDEKPRVKTIQIKDIQKQFFSASGRLLRLEGSNSPVLTLKIQTPTKFDYIAFEEIGTQFEDDSDDDEYDNDQSDESSNYEDANEGEASRKSKKLSLLEYLLRLSSLQEIEQASILEMNDEKLAFCLESHADGSALPKLKHQKQLEEERSRNNKEKLQLDSNISRLEHLSLEGK